jgi:hypothetical protein
MTDETWQAAARRRWMRLPFFGVPDCMRLARRQRHRGACRICIVLAKCTADGFGRAVLFIGPIVLLVVEWTLMDRLIDFFAKSPD